VIARPAIEDEIREIDAELRRLIRSGVPLSVPDVLKRTRAWAQRYRREEPERRAAQRLADSHLPTLLDLYMNGEDGDRAWVRNLLHACPSFRWAFGWEIAEPKPPASTEQIANALALLSMKDAGSDHRDQWVWLQGLCSAAQKSGLDVRALLHQTAAWSSDTPRFPPAPSTRALLLQFAERFAS
jgi:hypothetical protein